MTKYYTPTIEEFHIGFRYQYFETELKSSLLDENNSLDLNKLKSKLKLQGSVELEKVFNLLHNTPEMWKHRNWVNKIVNNSSVYNLPQLWDVQEYKPLGIKNRYRVKYLDKEDIEELGWIPCGEGAVQWYDLIPEYSVQLGNLSYRKFHLTYQRDRMQKKERDILCRIIGYEYNRDKYQSQDEKELFQGQIKNYNELKRIMKQLNI